MNRCPAGRRDLRKNPLLRLLLSRLGVLQQPQGHFEGVGAVVVVGEGEVAELGEQETRAGGAAEAEFLTGKVRAEAGDANGAIVDAAGET